MFEKLTQRYQDDSRYLAVMDAARRTMGIYSDPGRVAMMERWKKDADRQATEGTWRLDRGAVRRLRSETVESNLKIHYQALPQEVRRIDEFIEERTALYIDHLPVRLARIVWDYGNDPVYDLSSWKNSRVGNYIDKRFWFPHETMSNYLATIDVAIDELAPYWKNPFSYAERKVDALTHIQAIIGSVKDTTREQQLFLDSVGKSVAYAAYLRNTISESATDRYREVLDKRVAYKTNRYIWAPPVTRHLAIERAKKFGLLD